MGFNIPFYIILGTNLLTKGRVQIVVFFAYFSVSQKRNIKRNETFGRVIFGTNMNQGTWSRCQERSKEATRQGGAPAPWARPHPRGPLAAPPTYFFLLYIPMYPGNIIYGAKNPISSAATFCTREIPSWGLFRRSAGGGIDHGGLLHQHHSLSDDV